MTQPIKDDIDEGWTDLYFWLGQDAEEVSKEEFIKKQEELRKAKDDYVNVNWPS